jgi:hypothetical protein
MLELIFFLNVLEFSMGLLSSLATHSAYYLFLSEDGLWLMVDDKLSSNFHWPVFSSRCDRKAGSVAISSCPYWWIGGFLIFP